MSINRIKIAKEFKKITIHCFDIMKYNSKADQMNFSVWLNYRGNTYFSGNILVCPGDFCDWKRHKWVLKRGFDLIKVRGIQQILDHLEKNPKKNTYGIE